MTDTKFFDSKAEITYNAVEFLSRIDGYLTRWMQLAKVEEIYEGLRRSERATGKDL